MAQKLDFRTPFNDLIQYVPQNLRNPVIRGLIDNLFNRQMTHDESVPLFGYVGRKPVSADDTTPKVPQPSVERDINAVIPVLNFYLGSERKAFTVEDLIRKAQALGVSNDTLDWLYSQANNYVPPIDIDKFANFYNYYWIAKTLPTPPNLPWNPELRPEYYSIQRPQPNQADKLNVVVATTQPVVRTGTGFEDQSFTIVFTSPTTFTIAADQSLGAYSAISFPNAIAANQYEFTLDPIASPPPQPPPVQGPSYEQTFQFRVAGPGGTFTLLSFTIARDPIYDSNGFWIGHEGFATTDSFFIDTVFLSQTYNITFAITPGVKGKFKNINSLKQYQVIDGVQLSDGIRVLVKNNNQVENGIYIVRPQSWIRAEDYVGENIAPGARVWASSGTINGGRLFTSGVGNSWSAGVVSESNTNDWQEGNFWVRGDELEGLGIGRADVTQAVRPIIEYSSTLQLNRFSLNGTPSDSGLGQFRQIKTRFNQLPMFDLFRYDGTHANLVSSIFYYEEDSAAPVDVELQRRVRLSSSDSADFSFNHGLSDPAGNLLFYKAGGTLKTIWHAGYKEATTVDSIFEGLIKGTIESLVPTTDAIPQSWTLTATNSASFEVVGSISGQLPFNITVGVEYIEADFSILIQAGTIPFAVGESFTFDIVAGPSAVNLQFNGAAKGELIAGSTDPRTQQQIWTFKAVSATQFEVSGSKLIFLPDSLKFLTVGVPYSNGEISCLITSGSIPFDSGDTFYLRIGNLEIPRYVFRNDDEVISDLYGGPSADSEGRGSYQIPRTFSHNPYNSSRNSVLEGTLYGHFRGILQNQIGDQVDYAFGGTIKNWSEQHTLLASLLMQQDSTPISIIDLAQRQYETGLNAIADIFRKNIVQYIADNGAVFADGSLEQDQKLSAVLDEILEIRKRDHDVRAVLYDSTSGVVGIPITLPQIGILPLTVPNIAFDNLLGSTLLVHHDGHNSPLSIDDVDFRSALFGFELERQVLRSDGAQTRAAISSLSEPALPYRGQIWIRNSTQQNAMFVFDVDSDSTAPEVPVVGTAWYDRPNNILYLWDGSDWIAQSSHSSRWVRINLADVLNRLMLLVETRLYNKINPNIRQIDFTPLLSNAGFTSQLRRELFNFSAVNGLQPLGSDYVASNSLSWNYSGAVVTDFPALATPLVPARWYKILRAHQQTVPGVLQTDRPNLEPWRLLGFSQASDWWSVLTPAQQTAYTPYARFEDLEFEPFVNSGFVRAVKTSGPMITMLGQQVIDGITTNPGDLVLLTNEPGQENNGLWIVSTGMWTRSTIPLSKDMYVTANEGVENSGTVWVLSVDVQVINVDPVIFKQARSWTDQLWTDVQAARPALRLSVDTRRDLLLPPYVSPLNPQSINALTTVIPPGTQNSYNFGDGSPVETIWYSTLEYGYSLARALFRFDPLMFLGFTWGFNWVEVDGILYDGYDLNSPGHKRFVLHGDSNRLIDRFLDGSRPALTIGSLTGATPIDLTVVYDGYEVDSTGRYQNFSIRETSTGRAIAYSREGQAATFNLYGLTIEDLLIEDYGQPFRAGDSFRLTAAADGSQLTVQFAPAIKHQILGFGQVFSTALRESSIDVTDSYAVEAFRNWDVNMGYRAGGLVSSDDLKVRTENDTLSSSSFELLFKKNGIARDLWIQGLRIAVQQFGLSVSTQPGFFRPADDGADWVFKIEGYNPRYSIIEYYVLDTNGDFQTFNVLDQTVTSTVWRQYATPVGVAETTLPLTITGIQNVVNFLFGYSSFLKDAGWEFGKDPETNVDAETGRSRTWQLEIEKFIDRCYRGLQPDLGVIINPFMDQVWVRQETGLLAEFNDNALFDITANPGVFDLEGVRFKSDDLLVIRTNEESQFGASAPIFSAHAQIDEFEHLFIFKNFVEDSIQNGLLYDPFSGSRVVTYKFNGRRQAVRNFRPEYGGHYLVGNEVRQNLQASTDNIANFYDANRAFENTTTTRHALALLGFNTKDYFSNLDITDKTQFNFWRGLIQAKGTNLSIDAYLNNSRFQDAEIDEYWAYKVAEYGDARQLTYPELKLSVVDTLQQFTQLQFDAQPGFELPNFTQIDRFDESRWFSIDDLNQDAYFKAEIVGTFSKSVLSGEIIDLGAPADNITITGPAIQINSTTLIATAAGSISVVGYGPAVPRYNPVKLFNYVDDQLIEEIPHWHPAIEQHTPTALEAINIISNLNPARYNYSTRTINNSSYDPLRPWGDNEIGRVWFDTRNLEYIPYYDQTIFPSLAERLSRWGSLAEFGTIDVYEWVRSTVPPLEYNDLAREQAGDADLDDSVKAAGEAALEETYSRNRLWLARPIAWSRAGAAAAAAHPSFEDSFDSILYRTGDTIHLERGLFSDYGIVPGMRVGAWDNDEFNPRPLSELIITDTLTKFFRVKQSDPIPNSIPVDGINFSVSIESFEHTDLVGPISINSLFQDVPLNGIPRFDPDNNLLGYDFESFIRLIEIDSGVSEIISAASAFSTDPDSSIKPVINVFENETQTFEFPQFGIRIRVRALESGSNVEYDVFRQAAVNAIGTRITVEDAVGVLDYIDASVLIPNPTALSNNDSDPEFLANDGIGWRAWSVPTRAQLDADGRQPNSIWRPYVGDFTSISPTQDVIDEAVQLQKSPITLNNGVIIERFKTEWTDWKLLSNDIRRKVQVGTGNIVFGDLSGGGDDVFDTALDTTFVSVYVNGIAQLSSGYAIVQNTVVVFNVELGSIATVVVRKYEPSQEELAFDPAETDDLTFQTQYKRDYEYVELPVRDSEGSLTSSLYYFWVRNKSTVAVGKKLSIQSIVQQLRNGPPNFLTFQNFLEANGTLPNRYDAITISNLSYIVAKDDAFKLRFTRNFTLRNDPNDLDLKNVHTEWSLIRPGQRTRIPERLWNKLVESLAGQDLAGNQVPSLRRELYDERNGTTTRFGFEPEQTLGPRDLLVSTVTNTIVNTQLINRDVPPNQDGEFPPDFIEFLNFDQADTWFATPEATRQTMTEIWNSAKIIQINEIFFAALNDILASNLELTDIFKTSRLSAFSTRIVTQPIQLPVFE